MKFQSIELLRGIAAVLVVLFHTTGIMGLNKYYGKLPFSGFWSFGHSGVDFFFVLSGFIIHYTQYDSLKPINHYIKHRIIRIFPIYWFCCLLILPISILFFHHDVSAVNILKDILLFPRDGFPFIIVAWSLKHEILFYLVFSLFFINNKIAWSVIVLWQVIIIIFNSVIIIDNYIINFLCNLHNIEFFIGLMVSHELKNRVYFKDNIFIGGVLIVIFSFLFVVTGYYGKLLNIDSNWYNLIYGFLSALIVINLMYIESFKKINIPSFFMLLGSASYSIYLIHFTALSALIKLVLFVFGKDVPLVVIFSFLVILSIAIGILLHIFIEKPLNNFLKKKLS